MSTRARVRARARIWVAVAVTLAIVVPLGVLWQRSRLPSEYAAGDMGAMDFGGGPRTVGTQVSVTDLHTPSGPAPDVVAELIARQGTVTLASGRKVLGYTLNGTSPGPLIEATVGQLVEVRVRNVDVDAGIALHWHGIDVPNAEDGVAGITQDAVAVGESFTYRWVAPRAGTFWYHSHQVSHEQVAGGLLGALVIHPARPDPVVKDVVGLAHLYGSVATLNGEEGDVPVRASEGRPVRVRLINTDNGPQAVWTGAPYTLVATDGYDVNRPTEVRDRTVVIPAGGRIDLAMTVPRDGSALRVQYADVALVIGPGGSEAAAVEQPATRLDLLRYGAPAPVPFEAERADRTFTYAIGRRPGFLDGKPGLWWSVNGRIGRRMPMFVVSEGDVVHVKLTNSSGQVHPMHLHGHHAVVLSRDGVRVSGSPWWFDSLDVKNGESVEVAFLADNPGIWMDHCHNLTHATEGLVTHLMYAGVSTPFRMGGESGNEPE